MEEDKIIQELTGTKSGAAWQAGVEICGFINFAEVARKYFNRSPNWIIQRLRGNIVNGKPAQFKPEEMDTFAAALRDMAAKLNHAAERIEKAKE